MPVTYQIDAPRKLVRTVCSGVVTYDEVMQHFNELARDKRRPDRLDVLLDVSGEENTPDSSQVWSVALRIGELTPHINWGACAVVTGRTAMYGMMRMFESFADKYFSQFQVFHSVSEAETWLASLATATS